MDEMMEDVLAVEDDEEIEAEADAEVDKVLYDLTDGKLGQAGAARTELPASPTSLTTTRYADFGLGWSGNSQRRGAGEDDGAIPSSIERSPQLVLTIYHTFSKINYVHISHLFYTYTLLLLNSWRNGMLK
jgi:hypothetical protein